MTRTGITVLWGAFMLCASAKSAVLSDYLFVTDQAGKTMQEGLILEEDETAAADDGKVLFLNFKIDVARGTFMNADFPTANVHLLEPGSGLLSDTIQLMIVTTTPETITFQLQMTSGGEKT